MTEADAIRNAQRATWAALAPSWDKWDERITDQLRPVGTAMIERIGVTAHHRHLDVASGTGEPGLTVASIASEGRVVLTDLAPEMLAIAERRAVARGLRNVETAICSADDLPFPDATFDGVTVRFGYMFFPDLVAATRDIVRVLVPGGRACASVWVRPPDNPWTSIVMDAIRSEVLLAPPDPTGPNMFRCAEPGHVRALFEDAGLVDVVEWDVDVVLVTDDADEYWAVMSEHVSIAAVALAQVDDGARARIRARALDAVRPFVSDGEVRVPGVARCIVGTKPDSSPEVGAAPLR